MKSKVIVLSEDAKTSPSKLFRFLNSLDYDIRVKETCFGAMIEGEDDIIDETQSSEEAGKDTKMMQIKTLS